MEIVGRGFLAHHLATIADRHPHVTAIAAGTSTTVTESTEDFDREATLVYGVTRRCLAEGRTVVFFSTASAAMYGAPDSPGTETGPVFPTSVYGRHKLALENVISAAGVDRLIVRLSHVVGDRQRGHQLLPLLVSQVLAGRVTLHRHSFRDLLDVRHLVVALDHLLTDRVQGQVVNVASGIPQPVDRVLAGVQRRLGTSAQVTVVERPPTRAVVSTARLRTLVPAVADFGFGPDYLDALLDRYVEPLAISAREQSAITTAEPDCADHPPALTS